MPTYPSKQYGQVENFRVADNEKSTAARLEECICLVAPVDDYFRAV
jgi:hypothetical protein